MADIEADIVYNAEICLNMQPLNKPWLMKTKHIKIRSAIFTRKTVKYSTFLLEQAKGIEPS